MEKIEKLIERYKNMRSRRRLQECCVNEYSFVGFGGHSVDNLYPVLDYLHVPLKYICCRSKEKARLIERKYSGITVTTDLDDILSDDSVRGVFVSASPSAHFGITSEVLKANKALFVEKPPCGTLEELDVLTRLADQRNVPAVVGMQKRYSPVTQALRKALRKDVAKSYSLRYVTGRYPEGDSLTDLFIHPLDYVSFLFGDAVVQGFETVRTSGGGVTMMLILRHGCVSGMLELSTSASWASSEESLVVRSVKGTYEMHGMEMLTFRPHCGTFMGVPLEKIIHHQPVSVELFSRNYFIPSMTNNQIYTQGFYPEIKAFVDAVEGHEAKLLSTIPTLRPTYNLIDELHARL